jgi:quinol monooxygenase YgiN
VKDDNNILGRIVVQMWKRILGPALGLAMTALAAGAAQAQATFFTVTYVEASPKDTRQATSLLRNYVAASKKDDGNVGLELMKGIHRPSWFVVAGAWKDQKAYEAHLATAHSKEMGEKIKARVAAPNDTRQHTALSFAPAAAGKAGVCAVTHVDVIPPQRENGTAAVKQLAEDSRKHAGNIRFDVFVQTNRPNHFTVVECWTNRRAFDTHVAAKETRAFRDKLVSMTGALYDERLYKAID